MDWLNPDSIARGFDTVAGTFAWGTTFEQLEARGLRRAATEFGAIYWRVPGVDVLGLRSSGMDLMGPYLGRPVMQVWHRLDLPDGESHVSFVLRAHAHLVAQLGMPDHGDMQPARFKEENAWNVAVSAEWRVGGVNVGVSWYGAPRNDETEVKTCGILFLDWNDEIAAAAPWVDAWQREQASLDILLRQAHTVAKLQAGPAHEQAMHSGNANEIRALVTAQRVLRRPSLHFTVPDFMLLNGDGAADHQLVLWSSASGDAWGVSDIHNTVCCRRGETLKAQWMQVLPAKGGGSTDLSFGPLIKTLPFSPRERCGAIEQFMDILAVMPGASFQYRETYDC
ncbi:hypothetical protein ABL840_14875 [Variovorax sp. NFACC27]|uniref:hypothetical protein n=1 Tax=unclassified Variovorax TaxID=663243 RepID=UPI00089816A2|nr:hypothetical protein SAMN03159371_04528 [Variovorax sp. NFACC28]SEG85162.1 hypothetical protein SAMN03159365_04564 [Variovorax sp. NFACC29]SFD19669.1 hypothetical protein SAMN03159379_04454 [Variovorax sp. NFACC26]SFG26871.1 hypothetical protein SAMN03159447_02563 [Variovorax sp. NFACC27]